MSVTLSPGDLVTWTGDGPEPDGVLLVLEDGNMQFQFAGNWKYNADQVWAFLNKKEPFPGPGRLYKSYDDATGRSLADPELDLGPA